MGRTPLDLTGRTFGALKVIKNLGKKEGNYLWLCLCDPALGGCGRGVKRDYAHLRNVISCGCKKGRPVKSERNAEVYERWQAGESDGILSDEYLISHQRVYQIVDKEALRRGEEKRQDPASVRYYARESVAIEPGLADDIREGRLSAKEAAATVGVCTEYLRKKVNEAGEGIMKAKQRRAVEKNAAVYADYIAGATMAELAAKYGTTEGCICQRILRHRRRTGAPSKREHQKEM